MSGRKRLQDLTIKNNFMFGAVMCDESNCKGLLERVLQISIARVEISKEKSILYHPEYKGVRLDVYAEDENGTHYDIEMQALQKPAIEKRSRYYHSQMDMEFLLSGEEYDKLPNSYVIFICDFDPFGEKKYCYTFENVCLEDKELILKDGCKSIFLSTKGENDEEVSTALVKFLKFVKADLSESTQDFGDEFVERLQKSVKHVKENREMGERFMLFEELLKDERAEGRAEGLASAVVSLLKIKGEISDDLQDRIMNENDSEMLESWLKLAAKAESIDQFLEQM
ncbi:MAG: Rpn family recombination-promoting nuclease/putative transposase [Agathobacter sp.]|nr:Rpn family recombination-promoting nuclease/putative transposase [Agathobacter sp.]